MDGARQSLEPIRSRARESRARERPGRKHISTKGLATLRDSLVHALDRDELFLVYQPKLAVRRQSVAGAEALLRWHHPEHGLLMPDAFVPDAEAGGTINAIARWTLQQVINDQATLRRRLRTAPRLFMNVSSSLLCDDEFISYACDYVNCHDANIGFEVTETSVIEDPDRAIANLERCVASRIAIAIDDYGVGLSSLLYLKRMPACELKIDKSFITHLTSSHRDPLIVRSTIDLAHALDMEVTAEGVETPAALALLSVMGCEMMQGFLISEPLEFDAFALWLAEFDFEKLNLISAPAVMRPASFWSAAS